MPDAADIPFEDESLSGDEAAVDEAIRLAGSEREAIRALLIELAEVRAAFAANTSFGYRRGLPP